MPSPTYTLFRNAILAEQQLVCTRRRELCPHILGTNKRGEEAVLAWLPQWRCQRLAAVRNAHPRNGPWHEGASHRTSQTCVSNIELDINIQMRKSQ